MNKITYIVIALFLFFLALFFLVQERSANLKSQIIMEPTAVATEKSAIDTSSCERFSEDQMNDCFERIALEKKDAEICEKITKNTKKKACEREVDLFIAK